MSHTTRGAHKSVFSQVWSTLTFLPFLLACFVVLRLLVDGMSSGSRSASFSVSTSRDVLWECALSALPDALLSALRAAELDEPRVLCEYPKGTIKDLEMLLGETLGRDDAPSGAAQPPSSSCNSSTATPLNSSGTSSSPDGMVDSVVSVGGVPKPDHASLIVEKGGDPRTDLSLRSNACVDADSPQSGLATQTANLDSPACTVLAVSRADYSEHADGFSTTDFPAVRDGFPSSAKVSESRDGLPRSGDIVMNSSSDNTDTVFSRVFHGDEKSEGVRQSDSGVQIVPASGSPSELVAHQMGVSLAGTTRLKTEFIGIDSTGILDIGETGQLSIADRALMRKYKSLETVREYLQQAVTYKQEVTSSVSRVDGHPLKPSLSLFDRALLRKYPDANSSPSSFSGKQPLLSSASISVSSPPVVYPIESAKKRKRFFGKENSKKANTGVDMRDEHDQDQAGSPCGFQSKVAEPPVHPACFSSPSTLPSESADFAFLYYTLVVDNAVPMGYLQEFMSLEKPARHAAKRSLISAASISDSMASAALSALRREADRRATEFGTIGDQLVIAADMRPKKVSYAVAACDLRRAHSTKGRGSSGTRSLDSTLREFAQVNGHANGKAITR